MLPERRWRQGCHIWMCPTQSTSRAESSPHLASPGWGCICWEACELAVAPGRGAHSSRPARRERPAVTLWMPALLQSVHPKCLLTSWGESLHVTQSTPRLWPRPYLNSTLHQVRSTSPLPTTMLPTVLGKQWVCNMFWSEKQVRRKDRVGFGSWNSQQTQK